MNPERIGKLVELLLEAKQQIMVTTHNPLILNFLTDDVAKKAVILLYRTPEGFTRSVRYFDLPIPEKKLSVLGPGEVFIDTYLEDVIQQAQVFDKKLSSKLAITKGHRS